MVDDPLQSINTDHCGPFQLYFYLNLFKRDLEGSLAASASKTPGAPKRDSSSNKKKLENSKSRTGGEMLTELFSRNLRHNEHILHAFILENDIVFA